MSAPAGVMAEQTRAVVERLRAGAPVRRRLGTGARLLVDHVVPFLLVERRPGPLTAGDALIGGEASVLLLRDDGSLAQQRRLVGALTAELAQRFGHVLVIEVVPVPVDGDGEPVRPRFRVAAPRRVGEAVAVESLVRHLRRVELDKRVARVQVDEVATRAVPGSVLPSAQPSVTIARIEVDAVWRDDERDAIDAALHRRVRRRLGVALRHACFEFASAATNHHAADVHALGRRGLLRNAREIDRALADIQVSFDPLLAITPVDADRAYREFRRRGRDREPILDYPAVPVDVDVVRQQLAALPIERVEDPVLAHLFRETRRDLDLQLGLLEYRSRPQFLGLSLALHGPVDPETRRLAADVLARVRRRRRGSRGAKASRSATIDADAFAARAEAALERYEPVARRDLRVLRRPGLTSLVVSNGDLHVGSRMTFAEHRVEALLAHEVGTHVATYVNGQVQPIGLLATGLPGYGETQEGLAVLAEHLAGGLDGPRLRILAARVEAAASVQDGAGFVDTYRLVRDHGFSDPTSFTIALRVHRGGGYLKDAGYLRGLARVLAHVAGGGDVAALFVGKVGLDHLPLVDELVRRGILRPPAVLPAHLGSDEGVARLAGLPSAASVADLVNA